MIGQLLALALLGLAVPFFIFGCLAVQGRLSDTSDKENLQQGVSFIILGFLLAIPYLVYFWKSNRRSQ